MQLIGMLDSPYVRRAAVALKFLGIEFEHKALSVFSTFDQFHKINPLVKAPSLVCADGEVLMDSTLIIDYAESVARKSLMPGDPKQRQHALRLTGLALAACEKAVQIVYERNLRPPEKQHEPWLKRVRGQMLDGFKLLEQEFSVKSPPIESQPGFTAAVVWQFAQSMVKDVLPAGEHPTLAKYSASAEQHAVFRAYPPDGPGVPPGK